MILSVACVLLKKAIFGLEPTGNYHKPLAYWLIQHDYLLVAGKAVKDNRELLDGRQGERGIKTKARVKLAAKMLGVGPCLKSMNLLSRRACRLSPEALISAGTIMDRPTSR